MEDKKSKPRGYKNFFGVIFLHSCGQDFVIFDAEALQLPQINSEVHGKVSASNSFLTDSKAESILFHKLSKECVGLKPGKLVPLPLFRRVTAIPRQSSLFVPMSINVGEPDNVLIIEKTVEFNPSLGSAKGSIIFPNRCRGKVLLMVRWVDCQTRDEHGNNHLVKEEDVVSQVANFIDSHAGEGLQRSNVIDCFRDSKVPRVEYQTNVHTRFPPVEASQSVTVDQQPLPVSRYINIPRSLMEVFSVKFLEFDHFDLDQMYGCVLMSLTPTYVVFSRKQGGPLNITREGFVKLRGPDIAIETYDPVLCIPHLFRYETSSDQFKDYDEMESLDNGMIWENRMEAVYDTFLSKRIPSRFGPIEVDFAVYEEGVEARVEVSLTGCQFASAVVYGCITAENSKLGEKARSFLFNRDKTEGIRLDVSPYKDNIIKLPLSRSKTVHPTGSEVKITVNIWQSGIMGSQDKPIAKIETLTFTCLSGEDLRTFKGDECQVNVGVVWAETSEPENIECPFI